MSIPPYLTSGASSRAHHALIVALNEATSVQEEHAIVERELRRAKEVTSSRGSTRKIAETLVILLHCSQTGSTAFQLDWALVPALQLAESGKTVQERRIGYLYLCEKLPSGHELELMLINTIRKDLTSSSVPDIILGLHATTHLPSQDLLPAVTPLLTFRALLRHSAAIVRHKTLSALSTLFLPSQAVVAESKRDAFPLSMAKLVKLLGKETEAGPAGTTLRLIRRLIETKTHVVSTEEEGIFLVETAIAQTKRADAGKQLSLDALGILSLLSPNHEATCDIAFSWIASALKGRGASPAFLLATCTFLSALPASSPTAKTPILSSVVKALSKRLLPHSSSSSHTAPAPNDHVLVLRCLSLLQPGAWDTLMGESEMKAIMEGLNSVDDSIRLATLRLLQKLSPELLPAALQNHLESLRSSTDLALPLDLPEGLDDITKLRRGREETAIRAVEVVRITAAVLPDDKAGGALASGLSRICSTLSDVEGEKRVWEAGLQAILGILRNGSARLRESFTQGLLSTSSRDRTDHTLAVLRATTSVEYGQYDTKTGPRAISVLLSDIPAYPHMIQELLLVASGGILIRLPDSAHDGSRDVLVRHLGQVREQSSSYLRKRCDQIERVISDDQLLARLDQSSPSRALPDILATLVELAKPPVFSPPIPTSASSRLTSSALRYEAYDPAPTRKSRSASRSRRPTPSTYSNAGSPPISAGDYALFSADEEESDDRTGLLGPEGRVTNLVGLTFGEIGSQAARRVSDPFGNDDDDPATPKLR